MIDITDYSFENILNRMLARISDDFDKREGSVIYDALAPAAYELEAAYQVLAENFEQTFIANATGEYLDLRVGEMGLSRKAAVKAVRRVVMLDGLGEPVAVEIGARFNTPESHDYLSFEVIENEGNGNYLLECTEGGEVGNSYIGDLLPVDYIGNLAIATMVGKPVIIGEEEESDDELRERYFSSVSLEAKGGNVAQYEELVNSFDGVGRVRVLPCEDGVNTVTVSILDENFGVADDALIAAVQEYLDPDGLGLGNGAAPIGAKVTVSTASEVPINVVCKVSLVEGASYTTANNEIKGLVEGMFRDISYRKNSIGAMTLAGVIYTAPSVDTVYYVSINGETEAFIAFFPDQIPVLSSLSVEC